MYRHIPVMLEEAMQYLDPKPGEIIVDCTLGGGGYTFEIAKRVGSDGKVIAIDLDESAINHAKLKIAREGVSNVVVRHANFKELQRVIESELGDSSLARVSGLVFDLGLSSAQLEDRDRGFSFLQDAPLSMAFGSLIPADQTESIVNVMSASELTAILRDYGEERYAKQIAASIVQRRKEKAITTTKELVEAISAAVPGVYKRQRIHFATRTFQALRIATNDELGNLKKLLTNLNSLLRPGARIVAISFHSLEDRIVKHFFRQEAKDCLCPPDAPVCVCGHKAWLKVLTKKAVLPGPEEIKQNPRSRSAKLRAAIIL